MSLLFNRKKCISAVTFASSAVHSPKKMDEVCNFGIGDPLNISTIDYEDLDFLMDDFDFQASDVPSNAVNSTSMEEIEAVLQAELVEVPAVSKPKTQRFKTATEADLQILQDSRQSKATKKNTKWGIKVFQGNVTLVNLRLIEHVENINAKM